MSYILDALKKSEKERQRGSVPDLLTMQEVVLHQRKSRRIWPYAVAIAAVLVIGLSAYLALPGKPKTEIRGSGLAASQKSAPEPLETPASVPVQEADLKDVNEKGNASVRAETEKAKTSMVVPPPAGRDGKPRLRESEVPGRKEPAVIVHEEPAVRKEAVPSHPAQPAAKAEGQQVVPPTPAEPKPVHSDPPPVPGKIYRMDELPASVRQSLPPVSMSIFMYSDDPASRMVRINGQTYREGQSLGEGLKLEEIKPDGAVINYKNYRLHVGQKQ